jgi:DNA-binding XRE family transcriptional regulator
MPKKSVAAESMPPLVLAQLRTLGENLTLARKRRRETRKAWAQRIGVTEPTLVRMEAGDPSVSIGTYATALWLVDLAQGLGRLAAPETDLGALEAEVQVAKARSVRKPISLARRLGSDTAAPDPSQTDAR